MKQASWPLTRTPRRRRRAFVSLLTAVALTVIGLVTTVTPPQAIAATANGMSLAEAQNWVNAYKALPVPNPRTTGRYVTSYNIYDAGCKSGPLANCVALSEYFVNRYTTVSDWLNTVNGKAVVSKLASTYGWPTGTAPQAYSIFSSSGPSSYGHTGVVLGVNSDGSMQIAEASCTYGWTKARTVTLAAMRSEYGTITFVYPPASKLTGLPTSSSSSSTTTSSGFSLYGAIGAYINKNMASTGAPTSNEYDWAGGRAQAVSKGGWVVWTEATGAHYMSGGIGAYISGNVGSTGFPTTDMYPWAGGYAQAVSKGGWVVWTEATGTHHMYGGIGNFISGNVASTGFPTSEEYNWAGGRAQAVSKGGWVVWTQASGAHWMHGGIGAYISSNVASTGFPTSEEYRVTGGVAMKTTKTTVYWNEKTGAVGTKPLT